MWQKHRLIDSSIFAYYLSSLMLMCLFAISIIITLIASFVYEDNYRMEYPKDPIKKWLKDWWRMIWIPIVVEIVFCSIVFGSLMAYSYKYIDWDTTSPKNEIYKRFAIKM